MPDEGHGTVNTSIFWICLQVLTVCGIYLFLCQMNVLFYYFFIYVFIFNERGPSLVQTLLGELERPPVSFRDF